MTDSVADQPEDPELRKWHKKFAAETNGRAWTLTEMETLTADEQEEVLLAACASAYHWSKIGTEQNIARAKMLLARVFTVLGMGDLALQNAQFAYDYVAAHDSEPWEKAFAHAILAHAGAIAGNDALYRTYYPQAKEIGETLEGEDKDIFLATFDRVPNRYP